MNRILLILSILILALPVKLTAQDDLPDPIRPYRLVNDLAEVFSSSEKSSLEDKLRSYNNQTTTQIYVVTVTTFDGDAPYNYATRLANKWKIGQKGKDNGVLILIKPKTKDERGQVFIAPGYGLEERLNDAFCGRVIDNQMLPHLLQNDYYTAVESAVNTIIERIDDENFSGGTDDAVANKEEYTTSPETSPIVKYIILPVIIILFIVSPRFRKIVFFLLLMLMRGGGGGGRGSGGGFGGGGGGRFGGGGAGRGW